MDGRYMSFVKQEQLLAKVPISGVQMETVSDGFPDSGAHFGSGGIGEGYHQQLVDPAALVWG